MYGAIFFIKQITIQQISKTANINSRILANTERHVGVGRICTDGNLQLGVVTSVKENGNIKITYPQVCYFG